MLEGTKPIDSGYLLSSRDLCGLDYIPQLLQLGIVSLKIEGRMRTPEYVATVTKIYRKYIDLASQGYEYKVSEDDRKALLQVFNRGGSSCGHLDIEPNKNLIYPDRPDNIGIYVGNISNYNANKGHITLELNEPISIGDSISIEGETGRYTISELMVKEQNCKSAQVKSVVKLGRMKGKIKIGSRVYKLESTSLATEASKTYCENANIKKISLKCFIKIKANEPISLELKATNQPPFYNNITIQYVSEVIPSASINNPIDEDRVVAQFSKLGNTPYILDLINVDLDENLYVNISDLNNIRRIAISMIEKKFISTVTPKQVISDFSYVSVENNNTISIIDRKTSILLENINTNYDYSKIENIDNIYIPLKFLVNKKYNEILSVLSNKFDLYVYMPTIIKSNYKNLLLNNLDEIVKDFNIKGFVISNISGFEFLKKYFNIDKYKIIANYTMNIFNGQTVYELNRLGVNVVTPSIELNSCILCNLISKSCLPIELIAYGRAIVMNTSYCFLGKTNKCYPECQMKCSNGNSYYLKDRLGFNFRIIPDNIQTVTSIYNSKITSIDTSNFNVSSIRINILDENIEEINNIINHVKTGKKLEGNDYTNGNLNRNI